MSQAAPLSVLACGAFSQLLAGTSIDALLNDDEPIKLKEILKDKAASQLAFVYFTNNGEVA